MGTSSTTSSNSTTTNTGSNTNSTSVQQPIKPTYNLNVSQNFPNPQNSTLGGTLSDGIINSTGSTFSLNIPLLIFLGIILILIIYFIKW